MTETTARGGSRTLFDGAGLGAELEEFLSAPEGMKALIDFRRQMHRQPELGRREFVTTRRICERLEAAGLAPRRLPGGTGLICEFGPHTGAPVIGLRADIDALPVRERNDVAYRSQVDGVAHVCGHDIHTATVLWAGLFLARMNSAGLLPGRVRLIFESAEELLPSGAVDMIEAGGINGVDRLYALHCWPHLPAGTIGTGTGAVTSATDIVRVALTGDGGHTSRPHETTDVVYALSSLVCESAGALSRLADPRSGLSLVWGHIQAGEAPNGIPSEGFVEGTVRCRDLQVWERAQEMVENLVVSVAGKLNARAEVDYRRGMPPSVNDDQSVALFESAAKTLLGAAAVVPTEPSLGADSFGYYTRTVPGAYVWLGTAAPGSSQRTDLHRPDYLPDENCIPVGVKALAGTVLAAQGGVPVLSIQRSAA